MLKNIFYLLLLLAVLVSSAYLLTILVSGPGLTRIYTALRSEDAVNISDGLKVVGIVLILLFLFLFSGIGLIGIVLGATKKAPFLEFVALSSVIVGFVGALLMMVGILVKTVATK